MVEHQAKMKGHWANTSESAYWSISCKVWVWNSGETFADWKSDVLLIRWIKILPLSRKATHQHWPATKSDALRPLSEKWHANITTIWSLPQLKRLRDAKLCRSVWKHIYDATMIREWTHQSATRPVRKAYFSRFGRAYSIEKHRRSCTDHFSKRQSHVTNYCARHEKWCAVIAKCGCQQSDAPTKPNFAPAAEGDSQATLS